MADNQILKFGQDATNILTQDQYTADTSREDGVSPGKASSKLQNKFQRQVSTIAAGLAQFIADNQDEDVTDSLTASEIETLFIAALSNVPVPTPPQFDDSQKIATTEFIQRALGNFSNTASYAVDTTLTILDVGLMINAGANNVAFTLPLLSSCPPGSKIVLRGNGYTGVAVEKQGSDQIVSGSDFITSVALGQFDIIELTNNGVSGWYVTGGNEQLNTSSQFAGSQTSGGWKPLPGGLILQWDTGSTVSGTVTKDFPTPFTTSCFTVTVNSNVAANWANTECTVFGVDGATLTNTSYTIKSRLVSSGSVALNNNSFNMMAIGY